MLYAKQPKQLPNAENTMINNLIEILRKQWGYEESIEDCWAPFCIERGIAFSGEIPILHRRERMSPLGYPISCGRTHTTATLCGDHTHT